MISPYVRPQNRIFQNLRNTASNAISRSGALVIGTQYMLSLNDGRAMPTSAFSSAGGELLYRHIEAGVERALSQVTHAVKLDSVRLYGRDLEANVATGLVDLSLGASDSELRSPTNFAGSSGLHAGLGGRSVQVGDVFVIAADNAASGSFVSADTTFRRKVRAILPKRIASSVAATADASTNAPANVTAANVIVASSAVAPYTLVTAPTLPDAAYQKLLETGGRFDGKLGEEVTLVCTATASQGVATFNVSYTAMGVSETVVSTNATDDYELELAALGDAVVTLTHAGLASVGDTVRLTIFPVHAKNAATMFGVVNGALYTGVSSTAYVVEVTKGGANDGTGDFPAGTALRVYDTGGIEPVQVIGVTGSQTGVALGTRGLTFNIDTDVTGFPDLVTGDKFIIAVTAATLSTTEFDGVSLDGPAVNSGVFTGSGELSVTIRQPFSGEITSANAGDGSPFTATADGVTYDSGLGVVVAKTTPVLAPFVGGQGELVVAFKAAQRPSALEGPIRVTSRAAIAAGQFGELHIENTLAFGAYQALSGTGGAAIHALRTLEDSLEGFAAAFNKIRGTDIHYSILPLTDRQDVSVYAAAHCEEMSSPENMNFRRCYIGVDSPGEYLHWDTLGDNTYRQATLIGDTVTIASAYTTASSFSDPILPVRVGDRVRFLSLTEDLTITEIISPSSVRVSGAPSGGISTAAAFQVVKPDTADNTIDYVVARALEINNRRAVLVWSDRPTTVINGVTSVMPMKFVAAEIGGLRSILRPQQGLTMTEVLSVQAAPAMFARFTPEQLDRCASAGVMIVTQDIEGGDVFIRHQLTTRTTDGALQWEDSPGIVVDAFSFLVKDKFRGYLGKKNATPATLAEARVDLKQLAIDASQVEAVNDDSIGALILGFKDEDGNEGEVTVEIDGDLADKFRTFVLLRVALPINGLTHYIDAEASLTIG